jgi:hypothetical protein
MLPIIGVSDQKQACEQPRINPMSAYPFHSVRPLTRALSSLVIILVLVIGFSLTAYGANPVEEMAKMGTTDPKGDSWQAIQNSLQQFVHPEFILRLFLSLSLAVACAYAIAWHPRRSSLMGSSFRSRGTKDRRRKGSVRR